MWIPVILVFHIWPYLLLASIIILVVLLRQNLLWLFIYTFIEFPWLLTIIWYELVWHNNIALRVLWITTVYNALLLLRVHIKQVWITVLLDNLWVCVYLLLNLLVWFVVFVCLTMVLSCVGLDETTWMQIDITICFLLATHK